MLQDNLLQAAAAIVREAGRLMRSFDHPDVYVKEGHANYVTQGDIAVQQFLLERLSALCPESVFFAEEQDNAALTDGPTWVIDPIDGTTNYMRRRECSSISVGLLLNRQPVLGIVLNPYKDELFTAEKGKGAFLNDRPIHVSDVPFERALVNFGTSPYRPELAERGLRIALQFLLHAGDLRRLGSAAIDLCDVACGRADIFFELSLSPWDVAAASVIITEAGGVFDMPLLPAVSFAEPACMLAANPICYEQAKALLQNA